MLRLRPTEPGDLDFVIALERAPENAPFIGSWSREQHLESIERRDHEHWIVAAAETGERLGYLIAYDLVTARRGVYVKRVVIGEKSRGVGRAALETFCRHAFAERAADHVWLTVFDDNRRAQRAYAAVGFTPWEVSPTERAELHAAVGGFSDASVVLRRLAKSPRPGHRPE